jgi:hypothetical protein
MRHQINSYLAILLITALGSWATYIIVDVATSNTIAATFGGSETVYAPLQHSILNQ